MGLATRTCIITCSLSARSRSALALVAVRRPAIAYCTTAPSRSRAAPPRSNVVVCWAAARAMLWTLPSRWGSAAPSCRPTGAAHGDGRRGRRADDLRGAGGCRAGAALARGGGHPARARASTPCTRAASARSSPARGAHRGGQARRRDRACRRRATPGRCLRRGSDHARHRVPGRLPGGGGVPCHAGRASRLPRRRGRRARARGGGRQAGGEPHRRIGRSAGHRGRSRRRLGRSWSGIAGTRPARSCDASSTATRSRSAGSPPTCRRCGREVGRPIAGRGGLPGDSGRRRQDRGAPAAPPRRRAARARHRAGRRGVRHRDRRRRPRRAWRRPCTGRRKGCGRS